MTRINTNVGSLVAQRTLGRSNDDLQTSLTRLSTGLRINSGKDDPAGLIASEALRSDITGVQKAISNSERANQVIATADSGLSQVSSLLNDIRGLVTEAANQGALSDDQIAANQLQVDSSLEAINRIAQTTSFQGRKLLDGSLDFITSGSIPTVSNLKIDQAKLGTTGSVSVSVDITTAASQALITNDIPASANAVAATDALTFADGSTLTVTADTAGAAANDTTIVFTADGPTKTAAAAATKTLTFADTSTLTVSGAVAGAALNGTQIAFSTDGVASTAAVAAEEVITFADTSTITVTAATAGADANGITIEFQTDAAITAGQASATFDSANNKIIVKTDGTSATKANIATAIGGLAEFNAVAGGGAGGFVFANDGGNGVKGTLGGSVTGVDYVNGVTADYDADTNTINIHTAAAGATAADIAEAVDGLTDFTASSGGGGTNYVVANDGAGILDSLAGGADLNTGVLVDYDAVNKIINVHTDATSVTTADIAAAIDDLADFSATSGGGGTDYVVANDNTGTLGTLEGGTDAITGILDSLVIQIGGSKGSDVFQFSAGASATQIRDAINLSSDATGVGATVSGNTLQLRSTAYGSNAFVSAEVLSEGANGTFASLLSATRDEGTDIAATVNGVTATGNGNTLSINTSTLTLSATVDDGSSTDFNFDITGGGALFQLGPDVVGNQQARLGIQSLNTARLGGSAGKLFELASGGSKALAVDPNGAANVVEEAINNVTQLRGRLGSFQRTSLDSSIASLNDTLLNLTSAQSSVRDADFAAESARLTRAQILVQSGTSVLAIANQQPQNVLALLR